MPNKLWYLLLLSGCLHAEPPDTVDDNILRIEVIGRAIEARGAAAEVLALANSIDDSHFSSDSLANLLKDTPMVNLNGQGGLFQSINIRGFARWRVQTLVEGIPIYTERRAGSAAEFVPPAMVGKAWVFPAVAATQLGGDAIGGAVDVALKVPPAASLSLRYGANNDYRELQLSGVQANSNLSWIVNHQHANNSEDGSNAPIQDRFEQHSLMVRRQAGHGILPDALLLYSVANNIAKASADDPEKRFTLYPQNEHALAKLTFGWHNATFYAHRSALTSHITRSGQRFNALDSRALNTGMHLSNSLSLSHSGDWLLNWRTGIDARLGVQVDEREAAVENAAPLYDRRMLDAKQWQLYAGAQSRKTLASGLWVAGARWSSTTQSNNLTATWQQDSNFSAFTGYRHILSPAWSLSGYLSKGYRVPGLTERFYRGETPRGQVFGNSDLRTERANNVDLSLQYQQGASAISLALFQHHIKDYIELITLSSSRQQYQNLSQAEIGGINYQLRHAFSVFGLNTELKVGGQWLRGEDNAGQRLIDIVPAQHRVSLSWYGNSADGFVALTHRSASNKLVAGELATSSVRVLDIGYNYALSDVWQLSVNVVNLTDAHYVTSRDDLAPFARGREWVFSTRYQF